LILIVVLVLAFLLLLSSFKTYSSSLSILNSFNFAGFEFIDKETLNTGCGGASTQQFFNGEAIELKALADKSNARREISTDITTVDEILIIYEGASSSAISRNSGGSSSASIGATLSGDNPTVTLENSKSSSCSGGNDCSNSQYFQPSIWKFKNNFDGTWSSLRSLGVGDVFVKESTVTLSGRVTLTIFASANTGCGGSTESKSASSYLKVYNIVRKENSFAACKADQVLQGTQCIDLKTILLTSEEAIKESFNEKLARIEEEQQSKVDELNAQIEELKQMQASQNTAQLVAQIDSLQKELSETNKILADVQARDPNVIAVVQNNEQFEKPNLLAQLWNIIRAFFRKIFT
jgi:hypothetical protein